MSLLQNLWGFLIFCLLLENGLITFIKHFPDHTNRILCTLWAVSVCWSLVPAGTSGAMISPPLVGLMAIKGPELAACFVGSISREPKISIPGNSDSLPRVWENFIYKYSWFCAFIQFIPHFLSFFFCVIRAEVDSLLFHPHLFLLFILWKDYILTTKCQ